MGTFGGGEGRRVVGGKGDWGCCGCAGVCTGGRSWFAGGVRVGFGGSGNRFRTIVIPLSWARTSKNDFLWIF